LSGRAKGLAMALALVRTPQERRSTLEVQTESQCSLRMSQAFHERSIPRNRASTQSNDDHRISVRGPTGSASGLITLLLTIAQLIQFSVDRTRCSASAIPPCASHRGHGEVTIWPRSVAVEGNHEFIVESQKLGQLHNNEWNVPACDCRTGN
jgi:hypothetical protein